MVEKTYLRYIEGPKGGNVCSNGCLNSACISVPASTLRGQTNTSASHQASAGGAARRRGGTNTNSNPNKSVNLLFLPSLESVKVYQVRSGELLYSLTPADLKLPNEVTSIHVISYSDSSSNSAAGAGGSGGEHDSSCRWALAAGYKNGYVSLFAYSPFNNYGKPFCVFYGIGHKIDTAVISLTFDVFQHTATDEKTANVATVNNYNNNNNNIPTLLASGGQDTGITVWEIASNEPLYKLKGHRGVVTGLVLLKRKSSAGMVAAAAAATGGGGGRANGNEMLLLSGSADGLVKVWDLVIKTCVYTVVASDTNITTMIADNTGTRLFVGLRENFIKVYNIEPLFDSEERPNNNNSSTTGESYGMSVSEFNIRNHGNLERKYNKPVTGLCFTNNLHHLGGHSAHGFNSNDNSGYFLVANTSRTVEVFQVLSSAEVKKKVSRKRKRRQEQKQRQMQSKKARKTTTASTTADSDGDEGEAGDEGEGRAGEDEEYVQEQTVNEEVSLVRTFFFNNTSSDDPSKNDKIRSVCWIPDPFNGLNDAAAAAVDGGGEDKKGLHFGVMYNNNNFRTFVTSTVMRAVEGRPAADKAAPVASWVKSMEELKARFSLTHKGHQGDIQTLAFVDNDSQLLSQSRDKIMCWNLKLDRSRMEENDSGELHYFSSRNYTDNTDFQDKREENLNRSDVNGKLLVVSEVTSKSIAHELQQRSLLITNPTGASSSAAAAAANTTSSSIVCMAALSSHVVCCGMDNGNVVLLDIASEELLFPSADPDSNNSISSSSSAYSCHYGEVKDIKKRPGQAGFISVGSDRRLLLWTLAVVESGKTKIKKATLVQEKEVELSETPLFVEYAGGDGKFIAIGLQNNNIQLLFGDTFKNYLLLFGHSLVPSCGSFSDDDALFVSAGVDKNIIIWGTDFGDCHKKINAHDDYVSSVKFLSGTHICFSASLDGSVKEWDCDKFTLIQTFRLAGSGLLSLDATLNNTCVAFAGRDREITLVLRTQDIIFPKEEEERLAQLLMDEETVRKTAENALESGNNSEKVAAGQATVSSHEAAERLMEALDIVSVEQQRKADLASSSKGKGKGQQGGENNEGRHPDLTFYKSEYEYLWHVLEGIKMSEIRHCLSSLTTTHINALLGNLETMLSSTNNNNNNNSGNAAVLNYELAAKIVLALILPANKINSVETASRSTATVGETNESEGSRRLMRLRVLLSEGLGLSLDTMNYNIAGLHFISQYLSESEKMKFFDTSKIQGYKKKYHTRAL